MRVMDTEEKKRVAGYILSAIDMEERFAQGVYLDYIDNMMRPTGGRQDTTVTFSLCLVAYPRFFSWRWGVPISRGRKYIKLIILVRILEFVLYYVPTY